MSRPSTSRRSFAGSDGRQDSENNLSPHHYVSPSPQRFLVDSARASSHASSSASTASTAAIANEVSESNSAPSQQWVFSEVARKLDLHSKQHHHTSPSSSAPFVSHVWSCFSTLLRQEIVSSFQKLFANQKQQNTTTMTMNRFYSISVQLGSGGVLHVALVKEQTSSVWTTVCDFTPSVSFTSTATLAARTSHGLLQNHKRMTTSSNNSDPSNETERAILKSTTNAFDIFSASAPNFHLRAPAHADATHRHHHNSFLLGAASSPSSPSSSLIRRGHLFRSASPNGTGGQSVATVTSAINGSTSTSGNPNNSVFLHPAFSAKCVGVVDPATAMSSVFDFAKLAQVVSRSWRNHTEDIQHSHHHRHVSPSPTPRRYEETSPNPSSSSSPHRPTKMYGQEYNDSQQQKLEQRCRSAPPMCYQSPAPRNALSAMLQSQQEQHFVDRRRRQSGGDENSDDVRTENNNINISVDQLKKRVRFCIDQCLFAAALRCSSSSEASFCLEFPRVASLSVQHACRKVWLQLNSSLSSNLTSMAESVARKRFSGLVGEMRSEVEHARSSVERDNNTNNTNRQQQLLSKFLKPSYSTVSSSPSPSSSIARSRGRPASAASPPSQQPQQRRIPLLALNNSTTQMSRNDTNPWQFLTPTKAAQKHAMKQRTIKLLRE